MVWHVINAIAFGITRLNATSMMAPVCAHQNGKGTPVTNSVFIKIFAIVVYKYFVPPATK